jgi:hypothetical protein
MFHVEMRMGMQVVREFNLNEERLWLEFLAPLMDDRPFVVEDHEYIPHETRLTVFEGEELRLDQLGMGRGWQNVERAYTDVTERVLARAREHTAAGARPADPIAPAPAHAPAAELLRERLIGRLSAGPITAAEILSTALELMPGSAEPELLDVAQRAVWALLERDVAMLQPTS